MSGKLTRSGFIGALAAASTLNAQYPEQVHKFGPRLHHLIYEISARKSSPWNVIRRVALMFLQAKSVTLRYDSIVTTGIDDWGVAALRDLLDSYEDGDK